RHSLCRRGGRGSRVCRNDLRVRRVEVRRFLLRGLVGVAALFAVLGALFAYFVYSPDPEPPHLSGDLTRATMTFGGLERAYRTYVPRGLPKGAPLVVVMHGAGENGPRVRVETGYGFDRLADQH